MTPGQKLRKRFGQLSSQQRNEIYHRIASDPEVTKYHGLPNLSRGARTRAAKAEAQRWGLPTSVILDVYEYVSTGRHERE